MPPRAMLRTWTYRDFELFDPFGSETTEEHYSKATEASAFSPPSQRHDAERPRLRRAEGERHRSTSEAEEAGRSVRAGIDLEIAEARHDVTLA